MVKSNFHTHTIYCDGKNTPEEMIESAIDKGFEALGFSVHSYTDEIESIVTKRGVIDYYKRVTELKDEYKDKIEILCGIEQDYYSPTPIFDFDYTIGAVHYLYKNGKFIFVDRSLADGKNNIEKEYSGNFTQYAKDYYELMEKVVDKTKPDFIAHLDLVTKFNEKLGVTLTEEYFNYAYKAVDRLVTYGIPFEINTGAIARGYRTSPYPHVNLLKRINQAGGKIIINSDCHNKDFLDCHFVEAEKLAQSAGFTERYELSSKGLKKVNF
ncbi:MAG: histidinol-phosphatase [Clostridia bacterium]|nr:histidinol-phosphatase [Clostridia bacterium]